MTAELDTCLLNLNTSRRSVEVVVVDMERLPLLLFGGM
jgi:hypothetical protein